MKSFNQHITKDREKLKDKKLKEDLNKKKDEKLEEDLTDILWAAGAGAGLFAIGKAWDKWGTEVVASLPFASPAAKAAAIDKKKEKKDKKISDAQKIADDPNSSAKDRKKAEKVLDKEMSAVDKAERATGKKEKENNPGIYNGFYILGETYRLMGKVQEAVDNLELAISISPRNVESLISLGLIKIAQRNYDIARELFLRAKKQEPANPKIRKQLGFIYQGVGQSGLAIEEFQTYLKLFPNAPDRDQVLGRIQVLSR